MWADKGWNKTGASDPSTPSNYLDFELEIGVGRGREYPVAVLESPAGEAWTTMHFPFDELALENRLLNLQNALLRSGGEPRRTLSPEEQAAQDFGQELFETLFTPQVRSCCNVSLREAAQQRKGLRLNATRLGRLLADHASLCVVLLNSCEGARGSGAE